MRLKAKLLNIESGGPLIVVLNNNVVKELDLGPSDRVRVMSEKRYAVAVADSSSTIGEHDIGVFDELKSLLRAREPLYSQAEIVMDTSKHGVEEIVEMIVKRFGQKEGAGF